MLYRKIPPPPRLTPFVRFFWVLECSVSDIPYVHRTMADGCAELIVHYKGRFEELDAPGTSDGYRSMVHAQSRTFRRFRTKENFGIFGAYLYPFTVSFLTRTPSADTSDHLIDLSSLFGSDGRELEERLMLAETTARRIELLAGFLDGKLSRISPMEERIFSSIRHVVHSHGSDNVGRLAERFNMSTRQLERTFKDHAGFSPKLFSRIARFQSAIREGYGPIRSLTDLALNCGYYDQSHFIHEFKAFSGHHPRAFFIDNGEGRLIAEA